MLCPLAGRCEAFFYMLLCALLCDTPSTYFSLTLWNSISIFLFLCHTNKSKFNANVHRAVNRGFHMCLASPRIAMHSIAVPLVSVWDAALTHNIVGYFIFAEAAHIPLWIRAISIDPFFFCFALFHLLHLLHSFTHSITINEHAIRIIRMYPTIFSLSPITFLNLFFFSLWLLPCNFCFEPMADMYSDALAFAAKRWNVMGNFVFSLSHGPVRFNRVRWHSAMVSLTHDVCVWCWCWMLQCVVVQ